MIRAALHLIRCLCARDHFNEKYLEDAIDKGAVACVTENVYAGKDQHQVVQLVVNDFQKAMALLARVLQQPATGTENDWVYWDQGKNYFGILCPPFDE